MNLVAIKLDLAKALEAEFKQELDIDKLSVTYAPNLRFGDIATNAALVLAKDLGMDPRAVAERLVSRLEQLPGIRAVEVAGPGFVNIRLDDATIAQLALEAPATRPQVYAGKRVVTEFSDPNPFKALHVGHLYTSIVGDAIGRLIRMAGGEAHPVNFGGDVGLHVGKAMWAVRRFIGDDLARLDEVAAGDRATWMAARYAEGAQAYETDEPARSEIIEANQRVYELHATGDRESAFARMYWKLRAWSYEYFEQVYARIGCTFEKYYPESETSPIGLRVVREQLERGVFKVSDGAVVFEGEPFGLHTRVFITSRGLPTYEAKDVGLIFAKWADYQFDQSVIITGNDIIEYMKVVLKSIEQFEPRLALRTRHITHGMVKLAGGAKMSSRKGNYLGAVEVIEAAARANLASNGQSDERVTLGAIKYAFLKSRIGADMVYTPEESVSLDGNSGPYLQYAHARARSILNKAGEVPRESVDRFEGGERVLAMSLVRYPDVLLEAVTELMPHYICTYLYDLAQVFNRFYEANRVIGSDREPERLALVKAYADVLRDGLELLGIAAPDRL